SSRSSPWPDRFHRAWSHPIGIKTNPSLGAGFAGVLAHAVAAGIIASSKGSPRVAPAPFRNVRLRIAFFVMNTYDLLIFLVGQWPVPHAPHLKGNALHDSENQRRESVSVFLSVSNDLANGGGVVVLDASSECERHKLFRQSCCEHFGAGEQRVFKSI